MYLACYITDIHRWVQSLSVLWGDHGQHILFVCVFRKEDEDDETIDPPPVVCGRSHTGPDSGQPDSLHKWGNAYFTKRLFCSILWMHCSLHVFYKKIWMDALYWSKVTVKKIYDVIKDLYLKKYPPPKKFFTKILSKTRLIILRNVSWASNQFIRMISKWSCDTED